MTNHAVSNRADLRERTKTMSRHGDRRGQIADFRDSFETINWLYLLFKCGIKTKTHFEWLLWHWSSVGQLNLEPTRPNGLVGCKVPTDLVKISVKEATHMGFHYNPCCTSPQCVLKNKDDADVPGQLTLGQPDPPFCVNNMVHIHRGNISVILLRPTLMSGLGGMYTFSNINVQVRTWHWE